MAEAAYQNLSRRERQIMAIVFARGEASVADVMDDLPDPLSRSAVRTFLRILEQKGQLRHHRQGRKLLYQPTAARRKVGQSAFRHVLETFFGGSLQSAVAAYLSDTGSRPGADELKKLGDLIEGAKRRGR